jgi:hypothetical protein
MLMSALAAGASLPGVSAFSPLAASASAPAVAMIRRGVIDIFVVEMARRRHGLMLGFPLYDKSPATLLRYRITAVDLGGATRFGGSRSSHVSNPKLNGSSVAVPDGSKTPMKPLRFCLYSLDFTVVRDAGGRTAPLCWTSPPLPLKHFGSCTQRDPIRIELCGKLMKVNMNFGELIVEEPRLHHKYVLLRAACGVENT